MTRVQAGGTVVLAVVVVASLVGAGASLGIGPAAAQQEGYVVEQGEQCQAITPLSSDVSAEERYDYRSHQTHDEDYDYSSHGTVDLQRDDVSTIFLHEGPEGLSLVIVHDRLGGGTEGGVTTYDIVGLPAEGEWVVKDDDVGYDDVWVHGDVWTEVSWFWEDGRTDGGVYTGGLDDRFEITIDPAYGEEQETYAEWEGEVGAIHVLSGSLESPERIALASLSEPFVVRSGSCAGPSVSYERSDGAITGSIDGSGDVALRPPAAPNGPVIEDAAIPSVPREPIEFERLFVSQPGLDARVSLETVEESPLDDSPAERDGVESYAYLAIEEESGGIGDVRVRFSVDRSALDAADPESVVLYDDADGWGATEAELAGETGERYLFEASVEDGASTVAVATHDPALSATDIELDRTTIEAGESVEVRATVENTGPVAGTGSVSLYVFDQVVDEREVTVEEEGRELVTFTQRIDVPGTHTIEVEGQSAEVEVTGEPPEDSTVEVGPLDEGEGTSPLVVGVALGALVAGLLVFWWRY
ncbi:hypothetical protein [Natronorarus salvus]|uniref:hypothetical protein n=1 Tax=Natronorarus salvus TaxID=3117733 RepID=UPI002F25F5C9